MDKTKTNLRQLLLNGSGWFEEQVLGEAEKHGYGFVTPSMNRLFGHMRRRPISISELARKMGISRQAVHQTVGEAMRHGVLEFVDSETDRRIKLVRFSERGLEMSAIAAKSIAKIENRLASRIGREDVETLRRILAKDWKA
jgi:DNA-binding MarR family transcriptional regulator